MNFAGTSDKYFKAWNPNKEEGKKLPILMLNERRQPKTRQAHIKHTQTQLLGHY